MNDDKTYHYARLIEGGPIKGVPTKYARFTARKNRDNWVHHDKANRYTVPSLDTSREMMDQLPWEDVDGISMADVPRIDPAVEPYLNKIEENESQIRTLEDDIQTTYQELFKVVVAIYNKHRPEEDKLGADAYECLVVDSGHACAKSPTLQCVYHGEEDLNHDFCIFCGQPNERK